MTGNLLFPSRQPLIFLWTVAGLFLTNHSSQGFVPTSHSLLTSVSSGSCLKNPRHPRPLQQQQQQQQPRYPQPQQQRQQPRQARKQSFVSLCAGTVVTEEDVLAAVEAAESLWDEALKARTAADQAAGKAEAVRAGEDADTSHLNATQVQSLSRLADTMEAADEFIADAETYSQKADAIEEQANAALVACEKLLEQHLMDFPNSPLADVGDDDDDDDEDNEEDS